MFPLIETPFLKGQALVHFPDAISNIAFSPNASICMLEARFFDDRAKRVNDEIWRDFNFKMVKKSRSSRGQDSCYEAVLSDLITQISVLSDNCTGSGNTAEIMAKTKASVKSLAAFSPVYRHPPSNLREL